MKKSNKKNLKQSLLQLKKIAQWFEEQEQVDVEEGLEKVKQGTVLIKECKQKLEKVENQFNELRKNLET
ncbi:MAG: hypothetical protein GF332_01030 [Candidatus Moranbacteria bacterium]|nr:hypothetical protein [Candidatus Moranbacteria bacterium]